MARPTCWPGWSTNATLGTKCACSRLRIKLGARIAAETAECSAASMKSGIKEVALASKSQRMGATLSVPRIRHEEDFRPNRESGGHYRFLPSSIQLGSSSPRFCARDVTFSHDRRRVGVSRAKKDAYW